MRRPSDTDLLNAWDAGASASPARRAILLLQTVSSEPADRIAQLPLGHLSAQLLRLRAALFGSRLEFLANCPTCASVVEGSITVDELVGDASALEPPAGPADFFPLHTGRRDLEFRLPTASDLMALPANPTVGADALARSLIRNVADGQAGDEPPSRVETRIVLERRIAEHDPLSRIDFALSCPACATQWTQQLMVIAYLWDEIGAFARRLIREVARLAHAFGWSERDILSMPPQRRRRYLELLDA